MKSTVTTEMEKTGVPVNLINLIISTASSAFVQFSNKDCTMSRRKRTQEVAELDEDDVEVVAAAAAGGPKPLFDGLPLATSNVGNFQANVKEIDKFNRISAEAQAQCVKSVVRLFIMKGNKF